MPKKLDKDAIANIFESSNEDDDFSNGSSVNYEPSYSEVSSGDERYMDDKFVPIKTITSYRLPDIAHSFERTDNPYNLFMKVFPESLFMRITQCTNERIEIMRNSKPAHKNIKLTDIGEIKIVIGCMIIMSYNHLPSLRHYWSKHNSMGNDAVKSAITRDRFQLLSSKMYFASPEKPEGASKLYYVEDMVECLKTRFPSARNESAYQSIDESMTKCKGRSSMKQYIPLKPTKRGIKMWLRRDALTGYTYDFNIYCGREDGKVEGTLGERVVNQLAATIRETNVTLCFDRFFTSVNLLGTINYAALGTIKSNRKKLPVISTKLNRDQCIFRESNTGIMYAEWQDTKDVVVVSNCHSSEISIIEKKLKNGQKVNVDCPEMIKFYRQIMRGVDRADQIPGQYELDQKSNKWWKKVFYRLLMMSVGSCWVISSQLSRKQNHL
ncbi:piggyBac transposable element-derived protein 4-like [Anastrepha ludens]|uniref:piggyBac transposable element-derived protein 4-like n=1 Tax=Anastrepha ludens TaxID=28586 RepID=UPI0023AF0F63|nr:piggyBac transposable element-derived protein 4-like [Anastrepha ludens]